MELTCTGAVEYGSIIYYSHLIPIGLIMVLSVFVFIKSEFSFISRIFLTFSSIFSLWLLGDVVAWVSTDYNIISFFWSSLDYINILFYLFALYFFFVVVKGKDLSFIYKIFLTILSLPAWFLTISNLSIVEFDTTWCEAINNEFLTNYKLAIEAIVIAFIIIISIYELFKKIDYSHKKKVVVVSVALILFFLIFSITEYISSTTGVYEINLYSLFILPVFLFIIIFSTINLKVFNIKLAGTQLLVYTMIILVGSQFFFLENTTSQVLTISTFILSLSFGVVLVKDAKQQVLQRERIEALAIDLRKANDRLTELDIQKSEFVSFASHQLRAPLTAIKGYSSLLLEGEFGAIGKETTEAISRIFESSKTLATMVDDYLNISRIELGTMKYSFDMIDLKELAQNVIAELKPNIEKSKLDFTFATDPADPKERFMIHADKNNLKQVVGNLIDNSIKYTPSGSIKVLLAKNKETRKIIFSIKDTGVGIDPAVMPKLFSKFVRALNADKQNIYGTGLGLFVAKEIVLAHKGRLWAESKGEGKGSTFFLEMDMEV